MVTYTVYMKELSATSAWQDITHAVVENKDIPIRKGFGSLSDGIDVGSLSLTIHMETLQAAALLHVSQKQVLVQADGVTIFEGVSHDDADVDLGEVSDYVFVKLKFKPYSALFSKAKVPEDTVWMDKNICDPEDTENSLVHLLFGMIVENLPGDLPDILAALFNVSTAITNTKTLALVMLEAGESVEGYLTELLYQNGYAYWMELYTAIVVEPYATGRTPTVNIPITSVVANPDISQAPYIDEKKCIVRLGKIEEYTDEVVYELNGERYEDSGEPTQVQVLEPGDYYPLDSDEAPSELEADYETERENDDIELVYAEGLSYDYMARQNDPSDASKTIPAYIVFGTHELNPTQATFQLYNNLAVNVSLRNIRVLAQTAYYRNLAEKYFDESTTASEEDETDGIWMPDAATAKAFVSRYRAELKAQATHVTFQTHVALQPNTLFTITGLPYQLLVRYVTKLEEGFYEYECVAYSVDTISVGTRIRVAPKKTAQDGFSPALVHLYALGDETSPFDTSTVVSDGTSVVSDGINRLGVSSDWTLERPTPTAGQYVWQIIGYYTPPATWPTVWSDAVRLTGDKGDAGANGADGVDGTDGTSIVFKGSYASHPENPENGWAYYNTTDGKSYVYQSGAWYQMTIDGSDGVNGQDGDDGISIVWKGESADPPADPEVNWVYRDTDNGLVYIYNGIAWELMVQDGSDGSDGAPGGDGSDGASVEVEYSSDGVNWHDTYVSGDIYLRQRVGDGEWSAAIKFVGDDGVDAKGIALLASSVTIPTTSRGVPKISTITFTAQLQNLVIPAGGLVWTTSQPGLTLTAIDEYSISIDTEDVTVDSLTVQVSDGTYIAYVAIVKIADGQPAPYNFGGVTAVPTETPSGEPLVVGDYFLWAATTTEDYTKGKIYEWSGSAWVESTNGDLVMTMFDSFADLANDVDSTVIGNAVIKKLVAIDAVVKNLVAQNMKAGPGTGLASSGFRFRAQTDSVGDGSNVAVFDVYKDDKQLFKVDISTGIIYFGEHFWYDPSDGAIHTPNDKTVIKADGTIEAVDGSFTGDIIANSGLFKGIFDTTALRLEPGDANVSSKYVDNNNNQASDLYDYFVTSQGLLTDVYYKINSPTSGIYTFSDTYPPLDFSEAKYVRFASSPLHKAVGFYNSTYTSLGAILKRTDTGYAIKLNGSFTLVASYGGDKLIVSSDIPITDTGLDDYQIYIDNGTLKVKLP